MTECEPVAGMLPQRKYRVACLFTLQYCELVDVGMLQLVSCAMLGEIENFCQHSSSVKKNPVFAVSSKIFPEVAIANCQLYYIDNSP